MPTYIDTCTHSEEKQRPPSTGGKENKTSQLGKRIKEKIKRRK
jgi:hypothetical protein